jgi:hypothetical protein
MPPLPHRQLHPSIPIEMDPKYQQSVSALRPLQDLETLLLRAERHSDSSRVNGLVASQTFYTKLSKVQETWRFQGPCSVELFESSTSCPGIKL